MIPNLHTPLQTLPSINNEPLQTTAPINKESLQATAPTSVPTPLTSSSSKCVDQEQTANKVDSLQPISAYKSFREIERPSLTHESIRVLNARIERANRLKLRGNNYRRSTIKESAINYLRAAFILRIAPEDGVWGEDVVRQKFEKLISEVEQLGQAGDPNLRIFELKSLFRKIRSIKGFPKHIYVQYMGNNFHLSMRNIQWKYADNILSKKWDGALDTTDAERCVRSMLLA